MSIIDTIYNFFEIIINFLKGILCKFIDYKGCLIAREIEGPRDLRDPTYETDEMTEYPESPEESISSQEETEEFEILVSEVCPRETCSHQRSKDYKIPYYTSQLNINSSCNEIKNYILANLESSHPDAFQSSDNTSITDSMKKELIFVLENSSDMIFDPPFTNPSGEQITRGPGIRFKFCCPTGENCLL